MINSVKQAYDHERYTEALELSRLTYEREPKNIDALEGLARCSMQLKKYQEAELYCNQALEIRDSLIWPHCVLSAVAIGLGQAAVAKNEAWLALQFKPEEAEPNFAWGYYLYFQEKDIDQAIRFVEKAASIDLDNWRIYRSLSFLYFRKKDMPNHFKALKKANRLNPSLSLTMNIYLRENAKLFIGILMILYCLSVWISYKLRSVSLLSLPVLLDLVFIVLGVSIMVRPKNSPRSRGVSMILGGVIQIVLIYILYINM